MSKPGFRSFSPPVQRFFLATVVNMTGSGMIFAFLFIYLHDVRQFSGKATGLIMAAAPLATVAFTPYAGFLSDRFGPRRILTIGCLISVVASGSFAFFTSIPFALTASAAMGIANGLWFPSQSALLSVIVSPELRPTVMAFQRTALNLGAGFGGVVGGLIADKTKLGSYQAMFAINALTYLLFLACLPGMPSGRVARDESLSKSEQPGFREVFRDRFYLLLLLSDVAIGTGFGFAFGIMPGFASRLGISESSIGLVFLIGAVTVVFFQLPMVRWVSGRDRMRCLAVMNLAFAALFLLTSFSVGTSVTAALVIIGIAQGLGGLGETILGSVRQPLTSDLAPLPLVGRYFGLAAMVFQGSMGGANAIGGAMMDVSLRGVWFVALAFSLFGVVLSLLLRNMIPAAVRLNP